MKLVAAVFGIAIALTSSAKADAKPAREPKTRFSPALKCLKALQYGCHPYMYFAQELNHRGLQVEYRFERSRFMRPTGPGEHNLSNFAALPGSRAGQDGVYIMSLNGMNFCPLEAKTPEYASYGEPQPRFYERKCRALVMDPPLFKTEAGGALAFQFTVDTRPYNFVRADGKDEFGRTESTSRMFFWDQKTTPAAEVRSSELPKIFWNKAEHWDSEGKAAYFGAVAACSRATPAALEHYIGRITQYHGELNAFFNRVKVPQALRTIAKFASLDLYLKSQLPKLKRLAETGEPVAVDDYLRASYMVEPNKFPRPPRNFDYWQAQNFLGRSIRGELNRAAGALREPGCREAALEDADVNAALEELSVYIQNIKRQNNIR